jgi:mannose-1-phosphate guanylyltransferase/phosphomannomutase
MFSIVKILELIAKSGTSIEELDSQIPRLFMEKENISGLKDEKGKIMRRFMENNMEYKQELIDGVRIFLNDRDTVLCMPDKNRNLIHLNVETNSKEKSKRLVRKFKKEIQDYLK